MGFQPLDPSAQAEERTHDPAAACQSKEPYALMVLGDSMEPEFKEGDVIVIDPEGLARDGAYVVAWHNEEHIFRQLRLMEGQWHIVPLNRRYPGAVLTELANVRGVIVQKKTPGQRRARVTYE